ncbi:hypothetical protein GGI13_006866, partial [Coemansia sp. RSA 455]
MRQFSIYAARSSALATATRRLTPNAIAGATLVSGSRLATKSAVSAHITSSGPVVYAGFARCYSTESSQTTDASVEKHEFKAETKKLLHIVAHSLYSQREVFVRELISNSSDALEKLRHLQATSQDASTDAPLEVSISVDENAKTITFFDSGIGMTADELKDNLGTIARSGSKAYIEKMKDGAETKDMANTIVGQFGVGFYSAFMVGDKIAVYTRSATPGSAGYCWESDGLGSYTLSKAEDVPVGTKIVISVKDDAKEFLEKGKLEEVIKKYSNFVGFPISVNGEKVNTVEALWTKDKNSITDEDHTNFYQFVSNAWDNP